MTRRYFRTRNGAKSGSFVRLEKLQSSATPPCTILQALLQKYSSGQEAYQEDREDQGLRVHGMRVQLVGMEKLRRQRGGVDRVQEVALMDRGISSAVSTTS